MVKVLLWEEVKDEFISNLDEMGYKVIDKDIKLIDNFIFEIKKIIEFPHYEGYSMYIAEFFVDDYLEDDFEFMFISEFENFTFIISHDEIILNQIRKPKETDFNDYDEEFYDEEFKFNSIDESISYLKNIKNIFIKSD